MVIADGFFVVSAVVLVSVIVSVAVGPATTGTDGFCETWDCA